MAGCFLKQDILLPVLASAAMLAVHPVHAAQECAFVATNSELITIDTTQNSVAARIPLELYAYGPVGLTPDGTVALTGDAGGLVMLDTTKNDVLATIPLKTDYTGSTGSLPIPVGPYSPGPIAFSPDGSLAYATGTYEFGAPARAALLFVIDLSARQVIQTIDQAENAAVSPDGRTVYAIGTDVWLQATEPPRLLFVDATTGESSGTIRNLPYAQKIVVTLDGNDAYLVSRGYPDSVIVEIDTVRRTAGRSIAVRGEVTDFAVSADATTGYATTYNIDFGRFVLLDLRSGIEIDSVVFDGVPDAFAMTRGRERAYILLRRDVHRQQSAVGVVDVATRQLITTIPLPADASGIDVATVPQRCDEPFCEGDCDSDGQVTIADLMAGVDALLETPGLLCLAYGDKDRFQVSIDALIRAVNHALTGCA